MDGSDAATSRPVLDPTERRILGTLIEKSLATPDVYPLTVNALVAGCNQKSNRNPTMALEAFEIQGALTALQLKRLIKTVDRLGGRTTRYGHRLDEVLGLDGAGLAIVAELLLRGPQTVNELKTRIVRMGASIGADAVESLLGARATGEEPLFTLLPRRPGERYPRWEHRLSSEEKGAAPPVEPVPVAEPSPDASAPAPPSAAPASTPTPGVSLPDLLRRLEALEARVARLEAAPPASGSQDDPPSSQAAEWIDLD